MKNKVTKIILTVYLQILKIQYISIQISKDFMLFSRSAYRRYSTFDV